MGKRKARVWVKEVSGFESARGQPFHDLYHKNVIADVRLESRGLWREKHQAQGETSSKARDRFRIVNIRVIAVS